MVHCLLIFILFMEKNRNLICVVQDIFIELIYSAFVRTLCYYKIFGLPGQLFINQTDVAT